MPSKRLRQAVLPSIGVAVQETSDTSAGSIENNRTGNFLVETGKQPYRGGRLA